MLRGALLVMMLAAGAASAQERAPNADGRGPNAEGRAQSADGRGPSAENRVPVGAILDEPPPSAYDRSRQDGGQAPETQSLVGQFVKTVIALGLVIAIIWVVFRYGAARLLPGAIGPRSGRLVRIVERVLVDQKSSLLIVDVGSERMLLGVAEGGISVLKDLGAAAPSVDTTRSPAGFKAVLEAISPKKSNEDDHGGS